MDDLIKRLRESRAVWSNEGGKAHSCPTDLEAEAAAALSEAQAEIARLRGALMRIEGKDSWIDASIRSGGPERKLMYGECGSIARAALEAKTPDT
jgi:hypothetical protein